MKKIVKSTAIIFAALMIASQSAYADNMYVRMSGYTDSDALGVTVLILNKETNVNDVKTQNVKYITQGKINNDGTYCIDLPISFDYDNVIVRSNMNGFSIGNSYEERNKTVYVSNNGDDSNNGESVEAPLKTLGAAYGKLSKVKKIVIMSDIDFSLPQIPYEGALEIKGYTGNERILLPNEISLEHDMSFDNLITVNQANIFANGYRLKIGENVTSEQRLIVYGGTSRSDFTGDTNIELLGGRYDAIYGGSYYATLNGNTNVMVGGNVNIGDTTNDEDIQNYSPCHIYGGSLRGDVNGKTNITMSGNAVASYIVGGGDGGSAQVTDTNININGGKVMNVYGGNIDGTLLKNCNTHITMTGGLAEALFGGSFGNSMLGNTYINLVGGDVSRRVYTGCYNDWSFGWKQNFCVNGTTNLTIHPNIKLNTKTELSSGNRDNMGVFAGSRQGRTQFEKEVNTVIFADGCYDSQKSNMGDVSGWSNVFGSFPNYTVKTTEGGKVSPADSAGVVKITPDDGYYAVFEGNNYTEANVNIKKGTINDIKFKKDFEINSLKTNDTEKGITADVNYNANNITNQKKPAIFVTVYDKDMRMITSAMKDENLQSGGDIFDLSCDLKAGESYTVKAMIWNDELEPLTTEYHITVEKKN